MSVHLHIVQPPTASIRRIQAMNHRAENYDTIYSRVGTFMRNTYSKQFTTEGAFLGTKWKPLKPTYASWKLAHGGGRILVGTGTTKGELRDSYTKKTTAYQRITPAYAEYGSTNRLAPFHEFGTRSHRTGKPILPPRRVTVKNQYVVDGVKRVIADYITGRP